jgi:hypothetical protein
MNSGPSTPAGRICSECGQPLEVPREDVYDGITMLTWKPCPCQNTPEAIAKRKAAHEAKEAERWKRVFANLIELRCDCCGAHLGWVNACDLNGSTFVCDNCNDIDAY